MIAQCVNQLGLAHRGPPFDAEFPRALNQVRLGPVVVGRALAALGANLAAGAASCRVSDPGRLFLAVPLFPELLVSLLILNLRPGHRHAPSWLPGVPPSALPG